MKHIMTLQGRRSILVGALFGAAALVATLFVMQRGGRAADAPCIVQTFETSRFIVCPYNARAEELRLASQGPNGGYLRGFDALRRALGPDQHRVRFAMNAGMFNESGAPIGLYVSEGQEQHVLRLTDGPGNFHLKPNGVFWQGEDGAVHVDTSEDYALHLAPARWATQSGPMLVIDGVLHPRIADNGPSRYVRNGVGVRDGHTAFFVISSGAVSFGRFARFFRDRLRCRNALFLDGAVSSLWAPAMGRDDDNHQLGPMVVVLNRP